MYTRIFLLVAVFVVTFPVRASLVGTELSLRTLAQATPTSTPFTTSFERTVLVSSTEVEYPNVESLFNPATGVPPGFGNSLVNTAIDIGGNYITIDFDNSAPFTRFATGYENTYIFRFDSAAVVDIVGAQIDFSVTTLGLSPSDVRFAGNELFVNVESLSFNPSTFARINLEVQGGPVAVVPIPAAFWLFTSALAGFGLFGKVRRSSRT